MDGHCNDDWQNEFLLSQGTFDKISSSTMDNVGKVCFSCLLWAVDWCLLPITPWSAPRTLSVDETRNEIVGKSKGQSTKSRLTVYTPKVAKS